MQHLSSPEAVALYQQILANDNHWFETRVVIGEDGRLTDERGNVILFGGEPIVVARTGAEAGFGEDVVFSVRTNTSMFSGSPEVGKAVAGEIDVSILNPISVIPRMGVIIPYVRACTEEVSSPTALIVGDNLSISDSYLEDDNLVLPSATLANGYVMFLATNTTTSSEWIQQGKFYIDSRAVSHNDDGVDMLEIHGFDAMLKSEQPYASTDLDWENGALDTDIVAEIASMMNVPIDSRTWDVMNGEYRLPLPTNYTLREVLGYIASMYLGSFIMNDVGELRLVSLLELPRETRYLVDEDYNILVFGEDRITL